MFEQENLERFTIRIPKQHNNNLNNLKTIAKEKYDLDMPKAFIVRVAIANLLSDIESNPVEFDNLLKEHYFINKGELSNE